MMRNYHISYPVCPEGRKLLQSTVSKDCSVGLESAGSSEDGMKLIFNPVTPQFTLTGDFEVCVHFFRPSHCFRGDTLQPSLCRKFRYPACWLTHFSARSLIATPKVPEQSTATTPPLTSTGQETSGNTLSVTYLTPKYCQQVNSYFSSCM